MLGFIWTRWVVHLILKHAKNSSGRSWVYLKHAKNSLGRSWMLQGEMCCRITNVNAALGDHLGWSG